MPLLSSMGSSYYRYLQLALDLLCLVGALLIAFFFRSNLPSFDGANDLSASLVSGVWILVIGWVAAIAYNGGYNPRVLPSGSQLYANIIHATMYAAGITGMLLYLAQITLSRLFFIIFFVVGPVLLIANRAALRRTLNHLRSRGKLLEPTIIVGSIPQVDFTTRTLQRESWLGYSIIGAVAPEGNPHDHTKVGVPILGSDTHIRDIIGTYEPTTIIFTSGTGLSGKEMRRLAWDLQERSISMIVVPAISEIASDRVTMRPVAGLPLVHVDPPRQRDALRWSKRLFDIAASILGLIAISPLLLVVALVVKLHDGGPVFFVQNRAGRDGRLFPFYKFRSMVPNAEHIRSTQLEQGDHDRGNDVMFKMKNDPRITKPGKFLRRYSIDELPQLWNVLKGDMSLIGPRPALPSEVDLYDEYARRRLSVRPGITGLWQVSGRSDLSWDETVRLDLYYVDNWSFIQDLSILFRTVKAVLASEGAY